MLLGSLWGATIVVMGMNWDWRGFRRRLGGLGVKWRG